MKTLNFELNLGFYVKPDGENEMLKSNPIYVSAIYKIIKHKTRMNHKENQLKHKFENPYSHGYGFSQFISLKDILNKSYEIYNQTEDSVTLECDINILNELEFNKLVI